MNWPSDLDPGKLLKMSGYTSIGKFLRGMGWSAIPVAYTDDCPTVFDYTSAAYMKGDHILTISLMWNDEELYTPLSILLITPEGAIGEGRCEKCQ